jgi:hypothetical protein
MSQSHVMYNLEHVTAMVFSVRFLYRGAIPSRIWGEGGVRATIMGVVLLTHTQRRRSGK